MAVLDGMRAVFLEALSFVDEQSRATLVKQWNEQCEAVYKYKQAIIAEEQAKATAYGKSVAREIFAEIETVLCSVTHPIVRADGTVGVKRMVGLHLREVDYNAIKKKYESEGAE